MTPRIHRAWVRGCCGVRGLFHPGGGVCFCSLAMPSQRQVHRQIRVGCHTRGTKPRNSPHKREDLAPLERTWDTKDQQEESGAAAAKKENCPSLFEDSVCSPTERP